MHNLSVSIDSISKQRSWLDGAKLVLDMKLESLSQVCPECGRSGVPFPRWIKGPKEKPIYFLHRNAFGLGEACALRQEDMKQLRGKVKLGTKDIRKLLQSAEVFILFSGGSDSLSTLDYTNRIALKIGKRVSAIYVDTTVGFPEITSYVRNVCKKLHVKLQVLRPKADFYSLAKKWGIPNHNSRWCCRVLKIGPIAEFLSRQHRPVIVFDGIRAAESSIRAKYLPLWVHPSFKCLSVSPIFIGRIRTFTHILKKGNFQEALLSLLGVRPNAGAERTRKEKILKNYIGCTLKYIEDWKMLNVTTKTDSSSSMKMETKYLLRI